MAWEDHATEVMSYDELTADRDQWLAWRRRGLGGSDARVLMGHGYAEESEFTVLQSKLLDLPDREDNIRWRRGTHMESFIAEEFRRSELAGTAWDIERAGMWRNNTRHWQLANPDWRVGQWGMESKHVDNYGAAKAYRAAPGLPGRFYWQCLDYMDCLGAEGWWNAIDSPFYDELQVRYLDAEECLSDMLLLRERMGNWWEQHVVNGFELLGDRRRVEPDVEPDPDTSIEAVLPELVFDAQAELRRLRFGSTRAGKDEIKRLTALIETQFPPQFKTLTVDGVPVAERRSRRNPGQPDWPAIEKATGKSKDHWMTAGTTSWFIAEITPTKED